MTDWRIVPCPECRTLTFGVRHDPRANAWQVYCLGCGAPWLQKDSEKRQAVRP